MRADSRSVTGKQELILLERKLVLGTAGWGIIWRNQVPPPENLLVKGRVMLAADSTCQPCASSDTYCGSEELSFSRRRPAITPPLLWIKVSIPFTLTSSVITAPTMTPAMSTQHG